MLFRLSSSSNLFSYFYFNEIYCWKHVTIFFFSFSSYFLFYSKCFYFSSFFTFWSSMLCWNFSNSIFLSISDKFLSFCSSIALYCSRIDSSLRFSANAFDAASSSFLINDIIFLFYSSLCSAFSAKTFSWFRKLSFPYFNFWFTMTNSLSFFLVCSSSFSRNSLTFYNFYTSSWIYFPWFFISSNYRSLGI